MIENAWIDITAAILANSKPHYLALSYCTFNSARFDVTVKEEPRSPLRAHLPTESVPSVMLALFLGPCFSITNIRNNSLSVLFVQHHFKLCASGWLEISLFSVFTRGLSLFMKCLYFW